MSFCCAGNSFYEEIAIGAEVLKTSRLACAMNYFAFAMLVKMKEEFK
jgi:hypothetical protein